MNITAVIPTLNPTKKILQTVDQLCAVGFERIIVVNDGSDASYDNIFNEIKLNSRCVLLRHSNNRGKGRALKNAMTYFKRKPMGHDGIVTLDDDGQHAIADVVKCAETLMANPASLVLGVRDFNKSNVPPKSKIGNKVTNMIFFCLCGIKISDTQTGLRGIPFQHMESFLNVSGERFEYETNMLLSTKKQRIKIKEVTIETIYMDHNASSHFHPIRDSIKIYGQIFKFMFSSMLSSLIDITLFTLLMWILPFSLKSVTIFIAVFISRMISSLFNFYANKTMVFQSNTQTSVSMIRYYILCLVQIIVSSCCIMILTIPFPKLTVLCKVLVDCVLFFMCYKIQRNWVFQPRKDGVASPRYLVIIRRVVGSLCAIVLTIFIIFLLLVTMLLKGPSTQMSNTLVSTLMETSALKFIPKLYFTDKEIKQITDGNDNEVGAYINKVNQNKIEIDALHNSSSQDDIVIEEVQGATYYGKMVILKDPSRLHLFASDGASGGEGKTISEVMSQEKALVGFNGGAFLDVGGMGDGSTALGTVIKDHKIITGYSAQHPVLIGMDENNQLFVGDISPQDALQMGIRDAVSFGPVLVKNGEVVPQSGSGGGFNPRTAIGQRQDGSILVLIVDGRQPHSLGATYNDLSLVMKQYDAINAGNLDGGSSSVLYHGTQRINSLSSAVGERPVPTAFYYK